MKHNPKLDTKQYGELLKKYDIGKLISHDGKSKSFDSGVYLFRTTKGKYTLKIFKLSNLKNIKYQNTIIDHLSRAKIPVPENVFNNIGDEITRFNGKNLLIQKFVEGEEDKPLSTKLIRNMAKNFGKMHKAMLKFSPYKNPKLKESEYALLKLPDESKYDYVKKYQKETLEGFHKIPTKKLRKSHIHGDISCVNFLTKNDKLQTIIDWEEAHYGILIYDIAIFIAQNFIRNDFISRKKIKTFMKEYQKIISVNDYEKRAIYYLIRYRLVVMLHWYTYRMEKYNIKSKEMNEGINKVISQIVRFNKISLNDFLDLTHS